MPENRTRFRFGLRFLLLFTSLLALAFAWFAWQRSEGRRHEQIASKLESEGCYVQFSHWESVQIPNPPPSTLLRPPASMPLVRQIYFEKRSTLPAIMERLDFANAVRRISSVTVRNGADMPSVIALLEQIRAVDCLSFYETGVTESQLSHILKNVQVRHLYLRSEQLPRTSLNWLNHDGLVWLCVSRTQFSNPAINDLPQSIEYLDATRTRVNDDGLASFERLTNLKILNLSRTPTSEIAINALRKRMSWCKIKWERLK